MNQGEEMQMKTLTQSVIWPNNRKFQICRISNALIKVGPSCAVQTGA